MMAGTPRFKVYDPAGVYQAAVKDTTLAAAVVSLLGPGATVRDGHSRVIWREGQTDQEWAGASYDEAADTMLDRLDSTTRLGKAMVEATRQERRGGR